RQPIRDPAQPGRIRMTTRAQLISVTSPGEVLTPECVAGRGRTIMRTNAISLDRARRDLQAKFAPEEAALGRYVASLLRPNWAVEEELTERLRARETEALAVFIEFAVGDVVARAGQPVDAKILAVIQALSDKLAESKLRTRAGQADFATAQALAAQHWVQWLVAGLVFVGFALIVTIWRLAVRRRQAT